MVHWVIPLYSHKDPVRNPGQTVWDAWAGVNHWVSPLSGRSALKGLCAQNPTLKPLHHWFWNFLHKGNTFVTAELLNHWFFWLWAKLHSVVQSTMNSTISCLIGNLTMFLLVGEMVARSSIECWLPVFFKHEIHKWAPTFPIVSPS